MTCIKHGHCSYNGYVQKRQRNPTAAASIQRSNSELRRYVSQLRVAQGAKGITVKLALAKRRPGHCDRVSTTRVLGQAKATYRTMNVHTQVICVRLPSRNQLLERNKFWPSKQTNIGESFGLCHIYLQSVRNGQVANITTTWRKSISDIRLSNIPEQKLELKLSLCLISQTPRASLS